MARLGKDPMAQGRKVYSTWRYLGCSFVAALILLNTLSSRRMRMTYWSVKKNGLKATAAMVRKEISEVKITN